MNFELPEAEARLSKGFIDLHEQYSNCVMDGRSSIKRKISAASVELEYQHQRKVEYHHTLSQGKGSSRRLLPASYFSLESLLLLVCLTASLLILPLILPPLPPPPFMLLLVPIGILAVLMILAFMPCNMRDVTYPYV